MSGDAGDESFLKRWSRRKQSVQQDASDAELEVSVQSIEPIPHDISDDAASQLSPLNTEQPTPVNEVEALTDEDMEPIESLNESSDYTGFMSPEVSESLRKMALRKLFAGSQFQVRDGLDDYDEDFSLSQFEALGDIVTADMKHQLQREAEKALIQGNNTMQATPKDIAFSQLSDVPPPATGIVEYQSAGRLLVIGSSQVLNLIPQLSDDLQPHFLITDTDELLKQSVVTLQLQRDMHLTGYLGDFNLVLTDGVGVKQQLEADMVLNLSDAPLINSEIQPPGYIATTYDEVESHLEGVNEMIGTFNKPRYFDYDASICAHSSSGLEGCQNCIEACPADAIISIGERIEVNPKLCQGGGTCATSCPSGAIRYNYPSAAYTTERVRQLLRYYHQAGGEQAIILFHRAENDVDLDSIEILNSQQQSAFKAEHILPIACEELASVGADIWAAALSYGAKKVLLLDDENTPDQSRRIIQQQMAYVQTQLAAMGYAEDVIQCINGWDELSKAVMPDFTPANYKGSDDKRGQWLAAVDYLYEQSSQSVATVAMPHGAPFGQLIIDKEQCTLCMACATVCPASAISGGTESPQLRFFTNNCVQCGLCAQGCPEQAITLEPLYIFDKSERRKTKTLHEERPFHCISCNKPFASHSMISTMLDKLSAHAMFGSERALQRLKMCEDCRVVDVVQDAEAMGDKAILNATQQKTH